MEASGLSNETRGVDWLLAIVIVGATAALYVAVGVALYALIVAVL